MEFSNLREITMPSGTTNGKVDACPMPSCSSTPGCCRWWPARRYCRPEAWDDLYPKSQSQEMPRAQASIWLAIRMASHFTNETGERHVWTYFWVFWMGEIIKHCSFQCLHSWRKPGMPSLNHQIKSNRWTLRCDVDILWYFPGQIIYLHRVMIATISTKPRHNHHQSIHPSQWQVFIPSLFKWAWDRFNSVVQLDSFLLHQVTSSNNSSIYFSVRRWTLLKVTNGTSSGEGVDSMTP